MSQISRAKIVLASMLLAFGAFAQSGWAQASGYPSRIVRMIVPFPRGGGFDGIGRGIRPDGGAGHLRYPARCMANYRVNGAVR